MKDPWENRYEYAHYRGFTNRMSGRVAHIVDSDDVSLCAVLVNRFNRTPKPYPVCKNCLRTKRAKELGL